MRVRPESRGLGIDSANAIQFMTYLRDGVKASILAEICVLFSGENIKD